MSLRVFAIAALVGFFAAAWANHVHRARAGAAAPPAGAARLVALVQDVAEEYAEAHEWRLEAAVAVAAVAIEARVFALSMAETRHLAPRLERVARAISALRQPVEVEDECAAIAGEVMRVAGVKGWPAREPDLARGREVYLAACAHCHGADGHPDPKVTGAMEIPPPDLHDPGAMNALSPYRVYNAVSFGVRGTGMPEFPTLSDEDRWAVAFYTMTVRQPPCRAEGRGRLLELRERALADDNLLVARLGEAALPCVRR